MTVRIKKYAVAELTACAGFEALLREYEAEAAVAGLPSADEKLAAYQTIEASGVFHAFGAFVGGELVGFAAVVAPVIPHYGATVAVSESLFVAKRARKSGAGLALLRAAEAQAREVGSPALLVSTPIGGSLAKVLPRIGYRETNRVFSRSLASIDVARCTVPAMSEATVAQVRSLETAAAAQPQVQLETQHQFQAGVYSRTIRVPAGVVITGALIKIPTTLIVSGDVVMYGEYGATEIHGYRVMAAEAHRKQAFLALTETHITMTFSTNATTVEEAEAEFTDETDLLLSRRMQKEMV